MTTERQADANRRNALASTGPRAPNGKAVVARNAVKHGALSTLPVLPGLERAEDWEAHRDGVVRGLAPVGLLEARLAERAALLLWRLDRVARYETAVIVVGLDEAGDESARPLDMTPDAEAEAERLKKAPEELASKRNFLANTRAGIRALKRLPGLADEAPFDAGEAFTILELAADALPESTPCPWVEDAEFLAALGASEDDDFDHVSWTAGLVRRGLALIGKYGRMTAERIARLTARGLDEYHDDLRRSVAELAAEVRALQERRRMRVERHRARLLLPEGDGEGKVLRYESHLSRQLFQTLHELQRLQAAREGQPVPPPAVVEVGVNVTGADQGTDA
jgi:hypothetical protein